MALSYEQRKLAGITPSERGAHSCTGAFTVAQPLPSTVLHERNNEWMKTIKPFMPRLFESRTPEEIKTELAESVSGYSKGDYWVQNFRDGDIWFYPLSRLQNGGVKGLMSSYGKKPVNSTATKMDMRLWSKGTPPANIEKKFKAHDRFESVEFSEMRRYHDDPDGDDQFMSAIGTQIMQAVDDADSAGDMKLKHRIDTAWGKWDIRGLVQTKAINGRQASQLRKIISKHTEDLDEVSPPGWEGSVKAMKKHGEIENPYALAWYMKNKGAKPGYKVSGAKKESLDQLAEFGFLKKSPVAIGESDLHEGWKRLNAKKVEKLIAKEDAEFEGDAVSEDLAAAYRLASKLKLPSKPFWAVVVADGDSRVVISVHKTEGQARSGMRKLSVTGASVRQVDPSKAKRVGAFWELTEAVKPGQPVAIGESDLHEGWKRLNAKKVLAAKPTKIGAVAGVGFYEHPTRGDEAPLIAIKGGKAWQSDMYELPQYDEIAALKREMV